MMINLVNGISIVAVNFNNSDCSVAMLKSVLPSLEYVDSIVIVDNASNSIEFEVLMSYVAGLEEVIRTKIVVVKLDNNIGYFPGLNVGLKRIENKKRVVITNNDVIFDENFYKVLKGDKISEDVFVIAPDVVTLDGVHQNPHVISRFSRIKRLMFDAYYSNYYLGKGMLKIKRKIAPKKNRYIDERIRIHMGIGAAYILTEHFFARYGALEYPCFLYGEEAFLANQVHQAGEGIFYDPKYKLEHLESIATSKIPSKKKYRMTQDAYRLYKNFL